MLLRKCELRVKAMKEITKEQYLQDVNDFEKQCQSFKLKQESKRKIAADKIHIIFT